MNVAQVCSDLQKRFGPEVQGFQDEAIDPWIELSPEVLVPVCRFLRDEPSLQFNVLNCITGVDYFHTDPKKAAKSPWQPHLEVVYHLSSLVHKHGLALKLKLPPRLVVFPARSLRPGRSLVLRAPGPAAHPVPGRLGRAPVAQGLRDALGVSRDSGTLVSRC